MPTARRLTAADTPGAVDALLATLEHPHLDTIVSLRAAILAADPAIAEGVKWNAPSFRTDEYFATMHLRAKQGIGLILHRGAKVREGTLQVADPDGLLAWLAPDRAVCHFSDPAHVLAQTPALQALLRRWIAEV